MAEESGWALKLSDVVLAACTVLGPLLAVQAQKLIERRRETKDRKLAIFRTLMATRASTLSLEHVQVLSSVPIEFYSDKAVMDQWETYFAHLTTGPVTELGSSTLDPCRAPSSSREPRFARS
jgi:hypothetical protein